MEQGTQLRTAQVLETTGSDEFAPPEAPRNGFPLAISTSLPEEFFSYDHSPPKLALQTPPLSRSAQQPRPQAEPQTTRRGVTWLFNESKRLEEIQIEEEFDKVKDIIKQKGSDVIGGDISEMAYAPENYLKNRYHDVLPFEETRVKLSKETTDDTSDYINANYVVARGQGGAAQKYICCQAPLPNTIADFWRMIWEENCPVIVMLTKLEESGRVKSEMYWPADHSSMQYGRITVTHKMTKTRETLIVRLFTISHISKLGSKDVVHLQYCDWPDHGVPDSTEAMGVLIREVDIRKKTLNDPIVVHCSAGIGRTGTFLAVHMALASFASRAADHIDVAQTVITLREQRKGMVQSKDQYKLIYTAIRDMLRDRQGGYKNHHSKDKRLLKSVNSQKLLLSDLNDSLLLRNRPGRSQSQPITHHMHHLTGSIDNAVALDGSNAFDIDGSLCRRPSLDGSASLGAPMDDDEAIGDDDEPLDDPDF